MLEPETLTAGDSAEWLRTEPLYPASEWQGTYALFSATHVYGFTATDHADAHRVQVGASTTAAWVAGRYDWVFYLTHKVDAERRISLAQGKLTVLPNPASQQPVDGRSHAARMLDLIEAAIEGKATSQQLDLLRAAHNNRDFERNPELLMKWRELYSAEVRREHRQTLLASGAGQAGTRLRVRF